MKKKRRLLQSDTFWGLAAALLVLLQFWWLPGEDGSAADSYSTTVDGKLGLYRTLGQLFPNVERDALNAVPKSASTMILVGPDRYPNEKEQQELYEFVYNGGDLLFAPNWMSPEWDEFGLTSPTVSIPVLGISFTYRPGSNRAATMAAPAQVPVATPAPSGQNGTQDGDPSKSEAASSGDSQAANPSTTVDETGALVDSDVTASDDAASGRVGSDSIDTPPIDPVSQETAATPSGATPAAASTAQSEDRLNGDAIHATSPLISEPVDFQSTARVNLPTHLSTETLLTSSNGEVEAATWTMGYGRVVVCSSADLFSNRAMLYRGSRRLAVRLVERCAANSGSELDIEDHRIIINEYFNASDSFQNTGILFSPTLRIGTLQLLLVAILGIWMAFHRFGPAVDVSNTQRRSLTESAQAVGNLQYRLRDGGTVVRSYLDYMSSQLRRRYGSALRLDQPDAIANRAGMNVQEVRAQLHEAEGMAQSSQLSATKTAAMLRWLATLQQRLSGNRSV